MATFNIVAEQLAAKKRAKARARLLGCGLPIEDPALLFALKFVASRRSASTALTYSDGIAKWFGHCLATGVSPFLAKRMDAQAFLAGLSHYAPLTQNSRVGAAASFCEEARAETLIVFNPFVRVHPYRPKAQRKTRSLNEDDLAVVLRAAVARVKAKGTVVAWRDFAMLYLGARIGFRRCEYCTMTVGSIHMNFGRPRLDVTGKGGTTDDPLLPDDVHEVLLAWLEQYAKAIGRALRPDDALFPQLGNGDYLIGRHDRSEPIPALEPCGVADAIQKALANGGFAGKRWASHVLRATAATIAWKNGADRLHVMALLRQETPEMADHYINSAREDSAADGWRPNPDVLPDARAVAKRRRRNGWDTGFGKEAA